MKGSLMAKTNTPAEKAASVADNATEKAMAASIAPDPPAERMSFENRIAWLENAVGPMLDGQCGRLDRLESAVGDLSAAFGVRVERLDRVEHVVGRVQEQFEQMKIALDAILVERATIKALIQKVIS